MTKEENDKMGEEWSSFERYLIKRIDKLEERLSKLEIKVYTVATIITILLNLANKKGWI